MTELLEKYIVEVASDVSGFLDGMNQVQGGLGGLSGAIKALPVAAFFGKAIKDAMDSESALSKLKAVVKSTSAPFIEASKQQAYWVTTTRMSAGAADKLRGELDKVNAKIYDMSQRKHLGASASLELQELQSKAASMSATLAGAGDKVKRFIDPLKGFVPRSTLDELTQLAGALQKVTRFSDETIMETEAVLMTFTKIGKDVMPEATEATLNMATIMGGDTKGAAVQLGKALNDPIAGIKALTRVGVTFSKEQEQQIRRLVSQGKLQEAQKVILKELATEFGGAARAAGDTMAGALDILGNAFGEVSEQIGMAFAPAIRFVAGAMTGLLDAVGPLDPAFATLIAGAGAFILASGPIGALLGTIGGPVVLLTTGVIALAAAWNENFAGIKDIVANVVSVVQPGLDQLQSGVSKFAEAFGQTKAAPVAGDMNAGAGFGQGMNGQAEGQALTLGQRIGAALKAGLPDILAGLSSMALDLIKALPSIFTDVAKNLADVIIDGVNGAFGTNFSVDKSLGTLKDVVENGIPTVLSGLGAKVDTALQPFRDAWDKIFGDSPESVKTKAISAFDSIPDAIGAVFALGGRITSAIQPFLDTWDGWFGDGEGGLKATVGTAIQGVGDFFNNIFNGDSSTIGVAINAAKGIIGTITEKVGGVASAIGESFKGIAQTIMRPFADVIRFIGKLLMKAGELGGVFSNLSAQGQGLVNAANSLSPEGAAFGTPKMKAGVPLRVGEHGPETILPNMTGTVLSHSMFDPMAGSGGGGGGSGMTIQQANITVMGAQNASALLKDIQRQAKAQNKPLLRAG